MMKGGECETHENVKEQEKEKEKSAELRNWIKKKKWYDIRQSDSRS